MGVTVPSCPWGGAGEVMDPAQSGPVQGVRQAMLLMARCSGHSPSSPSARTCAVGGVQGEVLGHSRRGAAARGCRNTAYALGWSRSADARPGAADVLLRPPRRPGCRHPDRRELARLHARRDLLRFVLGIGFMARRSVSDSIDFFLSGRSLPAWVTGLAFISANLGAVEIMGMSANGAEFGMPTVHYFWVGAIPAMLFLGVVMMPFYYGSKVRSVPEFMFRRFGTGAHLVNAISFAVAQLLIAGVNLYLLGSIVHALLGWPLWVALIVAGRDRAVLHHPRRPLGGDLQRGAAVLRHRGLAAAADPDRPAPGRWLRRAQGQAHGVRRRARRPAPRWPRPPSSSSRGRARRCRASTRRSGRSSASSSGSASCCPSATGRPTSSRCSARWRPSRSRRPARRRSSAPSPRCSSRSSSSSPAWSRRCW